MITKTGLRFDEIKTKIQIFVPVKYRFLL